MPASAAPVATVQVAPAGSVAPGQAAKPVDLASVCVSGDSARADDSCRGSERRVSLRVDKPITLCRALDGALTGGRCDDDERELTLPRNNRALLCATGRNGDLVHIGRRSECADRPFRAINHVPGIPRLTGHTVAEGSGRVSVGLLNARNTDAGDRIAFRLRDGQGDEDNDRFLIRHDELFLTESVSAAEHPTLAVRIQAVDLMGKRLGRALQVRVVGRTPTPTPTAGPTPTPTSTPTSTPTTTQTTTTPTATPTVQPTTFDLSPRSIAENAVARVGTLSIADPDAASAPVFAITAGGDDLEIRNGDEVWTTHALDHEATPTVPVTIRVTDNGVVDLTRGFTVTVTDVDEDPTAIELDGDTVDENDEALIGTLSVDDPDADSAPVFSITSGGDDLEIRNDDELWTTGLDHETDPTRTVGIHGGGTADLDDDFEVTVTDVNEAPTDLDLSAAAIAENSPTGTEIGTLTSTDQDAGDTAAYALVGGAADNTLFDLAGDKLLSDASFDFETTQPLSVRVEVTDGDGETHAETFAITLTDVNEAPTTLTLSDAVVPEHQPVGTAVGDLDSTDPDASDTATYTLVSGTGDSGNDAFAIDGDTVKTAAYLDEATQDSYSIRVRVTDTDGLTREAVFTITVDAINDAPTELALSASEVAENAADDTEVGTLSSVDTDGPGPFTYALVAGAGDTDNAAFTIDGDSLTADSAFDFEDKASYAIRVRVSDAGDPAQSLAQTFTITVTDVNEAPTTLTLADSVVAEHQPAGTAVGDLTSTDPDAGDTATYALVSGTGDSGNATFAIDGDTVETAAYLDEATQGSYSIRVRVTDSDGLSREAVFTITVDAINDPPTQLSLSGTTIPENSVDDATVGTFSTVDTDGAGPYTYELVAGAGGGDNDRFTVTGNTLTADSAFDFEGRSGYDIRVRVTDSGTPAQSYDESFTISVTNVNEAPTDVAVSPATVAENSPNGTEIGTLSRTEPDSPDGATYALVAGAGSADNARFAVSGTRLVTAAAIDFETTPTLTVRVRVTDTGGLSFEKALTITVGNVNEVPTALTLGNQAVAENSATGTSVGTFATSDPDAGDTATYSLVAGTGSTDNAQFAVDGDRLVTAAVLDRETKASLSIRVRVTDAGGRTLERVFTITVTNVNEAPTAMASTSSSVAENAVVNTVVGTLSATDTDGVSPYAYALVAGEGSEDNAAFNLSGSLLRTSQVFDFETRTSYSVRVRVTDAGGLSFERAFAITVSNVNEVPTSLDLAGSNVDENKPAATPVGTFSATDPDAGSAFSYTLVAGTGSTHNSLFTIVGSELRTTTSLNFEATPTLSVRVRVSDNGSPVRFLEQVFSITTNDVNDAPRAVTDIYSGAFGNTQATLGAVTTTGPSVTLTGNLPLANDSDDDGDSISAVAGTYTGSAGGTVVLTSTGAFTYTPQRLDVSVTDVVTYQVTDGQATTNAQLGLTIGARRIWWVDDSATDLPGDGTSASPYPSLTPLDASTTDPDVTGDEIFVHAGTYAAGITLETSQKLVGERTGLSGLVPSGAAPAIRVAGASPALTVASGSSTSGVDLASTSSAPALSVVSGSVTTATVAADVTVTGGSGWAVDLPFTASPGLTINAPVTAGSGGAVRVTNGSPFTGTVSFTAGVTSAAAATAIDVATNATTQVSFSGRLSLATGAADAVRLGGAGTVNLTSALTTITTTSGTGLAVGTGTSTVTAAGTITSNNATGQPLRVVSHTGGTVTVSAALAGSGITLSGNAGATVSLTGQLTLATTTAGQGGFSATGGGTISATSTTSTVSTTTAPAVNVVGTGIGAGHLVFQSVSTDGAVHGINVQDTLAGTGVLRVMGAGGTRCGGVITPGNGGAPPVATTRPVLADCSGGSIRNAVDDGVRLVNTRGATLRALAVAGSRGDGIDIDSTTGTYSITETQVTGSGDAAGEHGIATHGAAGGVVDVSVGQSWIDDSYDANVSGTGRSLLRVTSSFVTNAGRRGGPSGDGVQALAAGTQGILLVVAGTILEDNLGDHVQFTATEEAFSDQALIDMNLMTTSPTAVTAGAVGGGVVIATSGTGTGWARTVPFGVTYNTIRGARTSAVLLSQTGAAAAGTMTGTIGWNRIGGSGTDSCAANGGSGIDVRHREGVGTVVARMSSNTISECSGPAISVRASDGGPVTQVVATNNSVGATNGAVPQQAFLGRFSPSAAETANNACLYLQGTTQASAPADSISVVSHPTLPTKLVGYTSGAAADRLTVANNAIPASATGAYASGNGCPIS